MESWEPVADYRAQREKLFGEVINVVPLGLGLLLIVKPQIPANAKRDTSLLSAVGHLTRTSTAYTSSFAVFLR